MTEHPSGRLLTDRPLIWRDFEMRKKMTYREAMRILLEAARRDIQGAGCGFRSTTNEWREQVKIAIERVWKSVYGWEMTDSDKFNLSF